MANDMANDMANGWQAPWQNDAQPQPQPHINTPIPPEGGKAEPAKQEKRGRKKSTEPLQSFLERCKAEGVKPIPPGDPIFKYAENVGLTTEMVALCWFVFKKRHLAPTAKGQKDWRAHFRNAVKGNWHKLWFIGNDGTSGLTTAGQQAQREMAAERAGEGQA